MKTEAASDDLLARVTIRIIPLLKDLPLEGSLITADAMHCQQESARFITQDLGGDYIFGLKGNQSGVRERAECKLSPVFFPSGE